MLNIGLIGDILLLEPYIKKAQMNPKVNLIGKSSVGTQPAPSSYRLHAPEFNRIELIERSDVLLINKFSLLPFTMLCDMVKKSKHIFAAGYPELSPYEINQLAKLAHEAKTVIQFSNPYFFHPVIQWTMKNIKKPALAKLIYFNRNNPDKDTLLQILMMLRSFINDMPKKSKAYCFNTIPAQSVYNQVHLDFVSGSSIHLEFGQMKDTEQFRLNIFMNNQFIELDLLQEKYTNNNIPIDLSESKYTSEIDAFLESITEKRKSESDIEVFSIVLQTYKLIREKIDRYCTY